MAEKQSLPQGVFFCTQDQARQRYADRKARIHREAVQQWEAEGKFGPAPAMTPGDLKIDVGNLGQARRGDWLRLMIDYERSEGVRDYEMLTAMVKEVNPQLAQAGLLKIRILCHPEWSAKHSVIYGDDITIQTSWVIEHSRATDANVRTTGHFLEDMQLIPPQPGKRYWTRDGQEAIIWTQMTDSQGAYVLGEVAGLRNIEWLPSGAHRGNVQGLDIVKDPTASEIIREAS